MKSDTFDNEPPLIQPRSYFLGIPLPERWLRKREYDLYRERCRAWREWYEREQTRLREVHDATGVHDWLDVSNHTEGHKVICRFCGVVNEADPTLCSTCGVLRTDPPTTGCTSPAEHIWVGFMPKGAA